MGLEQVVGKLETRTDKRTHGLPRHRKSDQQ